MASQLPEPTISSGVQMAGPQPSSWRKLLGLLRQRCPRCLRGKLFRGWFEMNDPCPVCGLVIEREEGYFLGAMYFSYFLAVIVLGGGYFLVKWRLAGWNDYALIAGLVVLYVPLMPVVFRYGRTVWIYFDRWAWPTDSTSGTNGQTPGTGNGSQAVEEGGRQRPG